jgi:hypothetical protein
MPHIVPLSALGQRTGAGRTRRDHWWYGLFSLLIPQPEPRRYFSSFRTLATVLRPLYAGAFPIKASGFAVEWPGFSLEASDDSLFIG